MAKDAANLSVVTTDDEWENVVEEQPEQVKLEVGESFIGTYTGTKVVDLEYIDDEGNVQTRPTNLYLFTADGEPYGLWGSHKLDESFKQFNTGDVLRITRAKTLDIGGGRTMNDFKIDRKRG